MALDCDVLRDIPSYRKILKVVLKSQIQTLVQQLFEHTGEESVLLSANVSNQSLSHLGSESGKAFLKECSDVKVKFLSFCAKRTTGTTVAPVNPSTTTVSPAELNNIPYTKKPYSRLQRRYSRLRSGGKQGLNAAYRTNLKERHMPYVSTMAPKSSEPVDLAFNPEVQGHSKVAEVPVAESSKQPETNTDVEATVVKIEPEDSINENDQIDNPSSNVSMETEKSPEGGENFQYVLNADLMESPWKQDEHSTSVANQSKRKQAQPIRIAKTASLEGGAENVHTPNKESQSDLEYSYDDAEGSPEPRLLGNKGDVVPFANHGGTNMDSQESPSVGYTWTEEKAQGTVGKAYMKTPQIDGIFVSRGLGRYEKLIRCDTCGKVCRTSNMARHKKRYCTAMSSNTPPAKRRHGSPRNRFLDGKSSDIYIDNPMEISLDSAQEMNGSGLEGTMESGEQSSDSIKNESEQEQHEEMSEPCNIIIKQEPLSYQEN